MAEPFGILTPLLMLVSTLLSPPPPPAPPPPPVVQDAEARRVLECVGRYESNGNYQAVSKSGRNRGKYQMTTEFFQQYGGDAQYAAKHELAPPAMQDEVALNGYKARGLDPWPGAQKFCS